MAEILVGLVQGTVITGNAVVVGGGSIPGALGSIAGVSGNADCTGNSEVAGTVVICGFVAISVSARDGFVVTKTVSSDTKGSVISGSAVDCIMVGTVVFWVVTGMG